MVLHFTYTFNIETAILFYYIRFDKVKVPLIGNNAVVIFRRNGH